MDTKSLAKYIDHTLLKPEADQAAILKLCAEAREHQFASVCVNPTWVRLCAEQLSGSDVLVCTVIGFPLGASSSATKAFEAKDAIENGAQEIDMVINIGAIKSGDWDLVQSDIAAVVEASHPKAIVKVILETGALTEEEKVRACQVSKEAGADFVKTSTGFGPGGATVEDIALMRKTVGPELGVKASGGVRDYAAVKSMIEAGATRIGASAGIAIVTGAQASGEGY